MPVSPSALRILVLFLLFRSFYLVFSFLDYQLLCFAYRLQLANQRAESMHIVYDIISFGFSTFSPLILGLASPAVEASQMS